MRSANKVASQRTWAIGQIDPMDPESEVNRQAMHGLLADLEATLFRVGGVLRIVADREHFATAGGEKLYRTVGYVVQWQPFAPARPAHAEEPVVEDAEAVSA